MRKTSDGQMKLASFFSQSATKTQPVNALTPEVSRPPPKSTAASASVPNDGEIPDTDRDALIAVAMAEEDEQRERQRAAQKQKNAPAWSEIFAKKIPPRCKVHARPCKDFSECPCRLL